MDLQNPLCPFVVRNDYNVRFLSDTDLVTDGVNALLFLMGVESQVIETAIGKSVTII
jgi:hypothetical protein